MRDRARQKAMAEAKSHRASPDELRDASKRVKELEQELLTSVQLQPETKQGEDRLERYSRIVRLRALRDDFLSARPLQGDHPSGLILALVMAVASFMLCGFCAGGALVGLQVLTYKPSATDTATAYWEAVEAQNYSLVYSTYLSPTLRVTYSDPETFATTVAEPADSYYGVVTNFSLSQQAGDMTQTAILTYVVTRGTGHTAKVYTATLTLVLFAGSWVVNDLGSSLVPWENSSLPAPPTPQPSPTPTSTATPPPPTGKLRGLPPVD